MKIKMNWEYAKGEFDTDTVKMLCIPARGKRVFGSDEEDSSLCIKDGMNFAIAKIHTGDVDSSNALCEEIARRWNEFEEWHECKDDDENPPEIGAECILRIVYSCDSEECVDYVTSVWGNFGWTKDFLERFEYYDDYRVTHWKPINNPKLIKEE